MQKESTINHDKEVATNEIVLTSDTTLMLDLMQVLFNVLPDTCVQVSVPTNKDSVHEENAYSIVFVMLFHLLILCRSSWFCIEEIRFLDVSWLEACACGTRASETDFPRHSKNLNSPL